MIKLTVDSRDKIFKQKFGQVVTLPEEYNADSQFFDEVQPIGDVKCTCYTTCDIAEDQKKIEFDILDLWNRIPSNQQGADPRDVLSEAVSNGLLPKGQGQRLKEWKSYWRADLGLRDVFDNVRSAIYMAQSPVGIGTYWYAEWLNVPAEGVMPIGKTPLNGHMYSCEGWKMVNGEPMFIIEAWVGRKMYMPRATFIEAMKPYGMQTWVLSTSEIDEKRQKTVLEAIRDLLQNVVIKLKQLIVLKSEKVDNPVEVKPQEVYNEVKEMVKETKYNWSAPDLARHSVRVICDEEGLSVTEKNEVDATIGGESGWKPNAIGKPNFDGTRDYGIVQVNEKYWIGKGKLFPSKEYVLANPEACVRWMCKEWKKGNKNWWYAYKNGSYKKFL